MKEQNRRNSGFILVEATVGVVLFYLLIMIVLSGSSFLVERVTRLSVRHAMLCAVQQYAQVERGDTYEINDHTFIIMTEQENSSVTYTHPSVQWYTVVAHAGNQSVTLSIAKNKL